MSSGHVDVGKIQFPDVMYDREIYRAYRSDQINQREAIFVHLKRHGSIDFLQSFFGYGIKRLSARIGELRDRGYKIVTEMIEVSEDTEVARYHWREDQDNGLEVFDDA